MEFPSQPPGAPKDGSRAGLWIALGMVAVVLLVAVGAWALFMAVRQVREMVLRSQGNYSCMGNGKQFALGMLMYVQDYDGKYPPTVQWADGVAPYIRSVALFQCPEMSRPSNWPGSDWSFNSTLAGKSEADLASPSLMPMLFETSVTLADDGSRNVANPLESFVSRHDDGGTVVYADGHVTRETAAPDPKAGLIATEDEGGTE